MNSGTVIAADWFAELARPWGPDPLTDQRIGGGIAWAIGEAPAVLVAFLFREWVREDEREQRRLNRAADRDGDAALEAYNRWLQQNAGGDRPVAGP
jgi:cytochrome c oxidase assembly factor CtaG